MPHLMPAACNDTGPLTRKRMETIDDCASFKPDEVLEKLKESHN